MWDIAPEFGAAIVFAEHRYYGESLPFGNETYSNISTMAYLSSEQALGDFAVLIKYLKEKRINNATKKAVVSFGGSYGGMLTAWMRIKYPHLIVGGLASSAPVHYFENVTSGHSYFDITIRTFENSGYPWSGGGWRQTTTNVGSLYSYVVEDSAHHYDLRGEHPLDTQSIKELRNKEKMHIHQWITEANNIANNINE
uniref:Uncharacterized protein n=1 Tax=Meloidogyne javanica TaxID=6303 RepID=A0A915N3C2_MELJA